MLFSAAFLDPQLPDSFSGQNKNPAVMLHTKKSPMRKMTILVTTPMAPKGP